MLVWEDDVRPSSTNSSNGTAPLVPSAARSMPPSPLPLQSQAVVAPPKGDWLYFITVDQQGTTKFSATFEEHLRNRKIACDNKFLTTGC